jgi:polar amino acid transport system permease protein
LTDDAALLLQGATTTLLLAVVAGAVGVALSVGAALLQRSGGPVGRAGVAGYVELIRNTPFLVQLFFIFFGLPAIGLRLDALLAAALAMTINLGAYGTEVVRAGIESVSPGQQEAARALGLHEFAAFRLIVLPQGLAAVYPALVSQIVIMLLESAVVSTIAVRDLTYAGDFIQSRNFRAFATYAVVTVIYLLLAIAIRRLLLRAGRPLSRGRPV